MQCKATLLLILWMGMAGWFMGTGISGVSAHGKGQGKIPFSERGREKEEGIVRKAGPQYMDWSNRLYLACAAYYVQQM